MELEHHLPDADGEVVAGEPTDRALILAEQLLCDCRYPGAEVTGEGGYGRGPPRKLFDDVHHSTISKAGQRAGRSWPAYPTSGMRADQGPAGAGVRQSPMAVPELWAGKGEARGRFTAA